MQLFTYFRSSAAYRVRIALHLKGLACEQIPVHLVRGAQLADAFLQHNPQALVPVLQDDGMTLPQSLAIMEYLDERYPPRALLPADAPGRARVRALSLAIACEIHPLNNLRVLNFLTGELGVSQEGKLRWYRHWVETGLAALERSVAGHPDTGAFCHGDQPTMADCCLVPQIFNARRFNCDLGHIPALMAIHDRCVAHEAFQRAHPAVQPDHEGP